jgi:hypothetical protein
MTRRHGEINTNNDAAIDNLSAVVDPTVNDDIADGWTIGSRWINVLTGQLFTCVSSNTSTADWKKLTEQTGVGVENVFELDGNGDLMPSLSVITDNNFESDGNGDIMPKG